MMTLDKMVHFVEGKARRVSNGEVGAGPWISQRSKGSRPIGPEKRASRHFTPGLSPIRK
jgi:hypothetical protein